MRQIVTIAALFALAAMPVYAGDEHKEADKKEVADGKAHNKFSPVSGAKIEKDKGVEVEVKVGDKTTKILVASKDEAETVDKANDELKKLYVEAAHHHKMVKEGKLAKIKGVESKDDKKSDDKKSDDKKSDDKKSDDKKSDDKKSDDKKSDDKKSDDKKSDDKKSDDKKSDDKKSEKPAAK